MKPSRHIWIIALLALWFCAGCEDDFDRKAHREIDSLMRYLEWKSTIDYLDRLVPGWENGRVYRFTVHSIFFGKELWYANEVDGFEFSTNDRTRYLEHFDYFYRLRLKATLYKNYRELGCSNCPYDVFKD